MEWHGSRNEQQAKCARIQPRLIYCILHRCMAHVVCMWLLQYRASQPACGMFFHSVYVTCMYARYVVRAMRARHTPAPRNCRQSQRQIGGRLQRLPYFISLKSCIITITLCCIGNVWSCTRAPHANVQSANAHPHTHTYTMTHTRCGHDNIKNNIIHKHIRRRWVLAMMNSPPELHDKACEKFLISVLRSDNKWAMPFGPFFFYRRRRRVVDSRALCTLPKSKSRRSIGTHTSRRRAKSGTCGDVPGLGHNFAWYD